MTTQDLKMTTQDLESTTQMTTQDFSKISHRIDFIHIGQISNHIGQISNFEIHFWVVSRIPPNSHFTSDGKLKFYTSALAIGHRSLKLYVRRYKVRKFPRGPPTPPPTPSLRKTQITRNNPKIKTTNQNSAHHCYFLSLCTTQYAACGIGTQHNELFDRSLDLFLLFIHAPIEFVKQFRITN